MESWARGLDGGKGPSQRPTASLGRDRGCLSTQGAAGLRVSSRSWADPPGPQIVPGSKEQCMRVELGFTPVWPSLHPPVGRRSQSWAML